MPGLPLGRKRRPFSLEHLELRDVPATGILQGVLWNDLNGNGQRDLNEPGLVGRTVYLDANNNGTLDTGELSQTTGAGGAYSFSGLAAGNYTVSQVEPTGWVASSPASGTPTPTTATSAIWQPLDLFGGDVQKVAFSPTTSGLVLAAIDNQVYHGGVYRSTDGGSTWVRLPAFDKDLGVLCVTFAPNGTAYAGTYQGLMKSTDNGVTWTAVDVDRGNSVIVASVAVSPADPNVLLVGNGSMGAQKTLFRTADGGATWSNVSPFGTLVPEVKALAFDPTNPDMVYAGYGSELGGGGEVWFSWNGGQNWVKRSDGLPNAPIHDFAFDAAGNTLVVGGSLYGHYNLGLYRSTDDGMSWTSLSDSWTSRIGRSVAVSGNTIAVGTENDGVYRSTDGGTTWSFGVNGTTGVQVNTLQYAPGGSDLFAGATAFGVLKSSDGGASFAASSNGMREFNVGAVAVNPLNSNELAITFSSLNVGGILTSTDGGKTWAREAVAASAWKTTAFAPDGTLYAVGNGSSLVAPEGLYRRNADGTWTSIGPDVGVYYENDIQAITFDPANPNVIFAAGETNYDLDPNVRTRAVIWKTTDGGATWTRVYLGDLNVSVQDLEVIGTGSTAVVLASLYDGYSTSAAYGGVARSADGGDTWSLSNTGLPSAVEGTALSVSAQNPNRVYLASTSPYTGYGLYVSNDGGQSWSLTGAAQYPLDVLVDPTDDRFLYFPDGNRSTDGGQTGSLFIGGLDAASAFYSDFHLAYAGGSLPRLYLNTWEGLYTTGLYSTKPGTASVTLADGETKSGIDFGSIILPGQITGSVWEDENADGVWGAEFGRQNWVVYLDANNNGALDPGEKSARTVAGGDYKMTGVAPGTYTLRIQMQPKYHQTYPVSGGSYSVTVNADGSVTGKNFGIQSDPTELRGTLWSDDDGDGVKDPDEASLVGWRVYLDDNANGKWDGENFTTTDANGNYVFTNLAPGAYLVAEDQPPYYQQTSPGDGKSVYDAALSVPALAGAPRWADHDLSTPNVIDVWYDFRDYNGYTNHITDAQKADARAAMVQWEVASGGKLKFTQNTSAPAVDIINIGTGDLAAVGYPTGSIQILGAGGASGNPLSGGVAWMDEADTWDTTIGNGDPLFTYDYYSVAGHEVGHALGILQHAEYVPYQWHVLMNAGYTGEQTTWSAVDRDLIRTLYGVSDPKGLGFYAVQIARGDTRTGLNFGNKPLPIPFSDLSLDFGPAGQVVAAGYTAASSATVYDAVNGGYGWTRGTINDVDRGAVSGTSALTRDFAATDNAGFAVDVPNGTYDVTFTFGDASQACDNVSVYLEHAYIDTISTNAGSFLTKTYRVTVSDRQLLIEMADFGGANTQIAFDALKVVRVMPSLTLSVSPTSFGEGAGSNAATGTVTRGGDLTQALTVTLSSSDTNEATVPTTVTIGAGKSSATFAIAAVDDTILDGTQTVTITASASGYNSGTKQVSVTDNETPPPPPPPPPPSKFDFGTSSSPVATGYTRVSNTTTYSSTLGYGWSSGTISATDRGQGKQATDLTRDFNSTANGTFLVNVPNGTYSVAITMGDSKGAHDNMNIYLEGTLFGSNISTASGSFVTKTYTVTVSDGQLTLKLTDGGGKDPSAVINGLEFTKTAGLHTLLAPETTSGFVAPAPSTDGKHQDKPPKSTDLTIGGAFVDGPKRPDPAPAVQSGYLFDGSGDDWFTILVGDHKHKR